MGLENYTTEELKAEISRRKSLAKMGAESIMRCKHCEHCKDIGYGTLRCAVRTWGKKIKYHYAISKSQKACELFQNKNGQEKA